MTKGTEAKITSLHPLIRDKVYNCVIKSNIELTSHDEMVITQGFRTFKEQDDLFSLGRTVVNPVGKTAKKPMGNIVTYAHGGQSYHNYGLAVDFALYVDKKQVLWDITKDFDGDMIADWMEVVKVFRSAGFDWGGNWIGKKVDYPHFQMLFGKTWHDLLPLYKAGKFISGTKFIDIK